MRKKESPRRNKTKVSRIQSCNGILCSIN